MTRDSTITLGISEARPSSIARLHEICARGDRSAYHDLVSELARFDAEELEPGSTARLLSLAAHPLCSVRLREALRDATIIRIQRALDLPLHERLEAMQTFCNEMRETDPEGGLVMAGAILRAASEGASRDVMAELKDVLATVCGASLVEVAREAESRGAPYDVLVRKFVSTAEALAWSPGERLGLIFRGAESPRFSPRATAAAQDAAFSLLVDRLDADDLHAMTEFLDISLMDPVGLPAGKEWLDKPLDHLGMLVARDEHLLELIRSAIESIDDDERRGRTGRALINHIARARAKAMGICSIRSCDWPAAAQAILDVYKEELDRLYNALSKFEPDAADVVCALRDKFEAELADELRSYEHGQDLWRWVLRQVLRKYRDVTENYPNSTQPLEHLVPISPNSGTRTTADSLFEEATVRSRATRRDWEAYVLHRVFELSIEAVSEILHEEEIAVTQRIFRVHKASEEGVAPFEATGT